MSTVDTYKEILNRVFFIGREDNGTGQNRLSLHSLQVFFLILVYSFFVFLIFPFIPLPFMKANSDCEPADISTVSGYYGPGQLLSWLVALSSTVLHHEWSIGWHFLAALSLPSATEDENKSSGLDGVQLTALLYSVGSIIDLTYRTIRGEANGQYMAAYYITWLSLVACTCCCAVERRQHNNEQLSTLRQRCWSLLWLMAFIALYLQNFLSTLRDSAIMSVVWSLALPSISLFQYIIVSYLTPKREDSDRFIEMYASIFLMASDGGPRDGLRVDQKCIIAPAPWALTTAKLTDMDQLSALCVQIAVALIPVGVSWWKSYRSSTSHRS